MAYKYGLVKLQQLNLFVLEHVPEYKHCKCCQKEMDSTNLSSVVARNFFCLFIRSTISISEKRILALQPMCCMESVFSCQRT